MQEKKDKHRPVPWQLLCFTGVLQILETRIAAKFVLQ